MKILKRSTEISAFLSLLRKRASGAEGVEASVKKILFDVKTDGDRSVVKYTERFDALKSKDLRLRPAEIVKHANKTDKKVMKSLETSAKRIRSFHEMQKEESWSFSEGDTILGQIIRPLERD